MFKVLSSASLLAPDGRSKAFDASGDGYGRGEGIGALALKRVEDAVRDGDPIRAVIRGTSSNQDGHTKGLTLPDWRAQADLIRDAYDLAGLGFEQTGYIEAHGTGTQAGDQEETKALSTTIAAGRSAAEKLVIGSVKSNIGHLEACAGLAAMVKAVLVLEHGLIPGTITVKNINPKIPLDDWKLAIPSTLVPFPERQGIRRVSVNGFGFAGTNAHVVMDDAFSYLKARQLNGIHSTRNGQDQRLLHGTVSNGHSNGTTGKVANGQASTLPLVFSLSAQDKDGIDRTKQQLVEYLQTKTGTSEKLEQKSFMADLAYTLNSRRTLHQWKSFATASSVGDLLQTLQDKETPSPQYLSANRPPSLGFVFTGQGAQWGGMGMELMVFPTFAESVRAADEYLVSELGCEWSAEEELRRPKGQSQLGIAEYSQTLCTVLQVALVDLLKQWGIEPKAVIGHSSGEIGAAYCLGALARKDAWKIAFYRGILSSSLKELSPNTHGAMMAVGASVEQAEALIKRIAPGQVTVACINSPSSVTLSGDVAGIDKLTEVISQEGIFARKLQVDTAYHSHHMEAIASAYLEAIDDVHTQSGNGQCVMYSSCTGTKVQPSELGPAHWVRNLVSPVRFAGSVQDIIRPPNSDKTGGRANVNAVDVLVEVGPHSALQGPSLQSLKDIGVTNVPYRSVLLRFEDGVKTALSLAGDLHAQSVPIRLEQVNDLATVARLASRKPHTLVGLPSYPWNHSQRYWAETRWAREQRLRRFPHLALLGAPIPSPTAGEHTWRGYMRTKDEPWLSEHKIQGSTIYPAAGFLAMAIEAAMQMSSRDRKVSGFHLRHVQFVSPMMIEEDEDVEFSIVLRPHQAGTMSTASTWTEFIVSSSPDGQRFERNCLGLLDVTYAGERESTEMAADKTTLQRCANEAQDLCTTRLDVADFYTHLASIGLTYGPNFRKISAISRRGQSGGGQSSGCVDVPDVGLNDTSYSLDGVRPHVVHPALLDAVIHMAFAAMDVKKAWIPKFVDDVVINMDVPWSAGDHIAGFCNAQDYGAKEFKADIFMQNPNTQAPAIKLIGLCYASLADEAENDGGATKPKSVCGKLDWKPALSLLDPQDIISAIETELCNGTQCTVSALSKVSKFIDLWHHENPDMKISEVASSSRPLLPELSITRSVFSTSKYECVCSDDQKEAIQEVLDKMNGQNLNFELISTAEALQPNKLKSDFVIASHMGEGENTKEELNTLIESLDGEHRHTLCLVDTAETADKLASICSANSRITERLQFKDDKLVAKIFEVQKHSSNHTNGHSEPSDIIILSPQSKSPELEVFENTLLQALTANGRTGKVLVWDGISDEAVRERPCISLVEFDKPLLGDLSEQDFALMKRTVLQASHLTWVTGADDAMAGGTPMAAMMIGVMRTLHNELLALQPLSILVDRSSKEGQLARSATVTAEIFCGRHMESTTSTLPPDHEFQIRNGIPYICRVLEDETINETLHLNTNPKESSMIEPLPISAATAAIELAVGKPGLIDSIRFEPKSDAGAPLDADDIEIAVAASGLNFREVMTIMGLLPSTTLGLEAAGTVMRVGSGVTHVQKGDRVALLGNGAHSTLFRSKANYAFKLPESMSFEEGASLPVTSYTAWYGVVYIARARKGQSILIHAGAGGVGQAALQIARHLGLEVFTTVSSPEKRQLVQDQYGVAEDHIFNSRDLEFAQGVRRMTNGRGVDIVLNSLAGESMRRSWECIAPGGHFVEIGLRDILDNTRLDMRPFRYGATFSFFDLKDIWDNRPALMAEIVQGTEPLLTQGIIKPAAPLLTHTISEMEKAVRLMQSGRHTGKIVLQWKPEHVVPTLRCPSPPMELDQNGVYVLVGGLGGLGRSLAKMLVADGARKLCFLNRSRNLSKDAEQLLAELRGKNIAVLPIPCDVSSESSLKTAFAQAESELDGPIRGCFQCAMVLRDVLFENMTYADWVQSTRPKVQGSKNLDDLLPETTDFFIMLSSFCGVFGNRGQANYVAGCGFQDALAHSRRTRGKHAVSIDLGLMREVGRLAEEGAVGDIAQWEKVWGIREHEFVALMRLCMTPDQTGAQLPTGLGTKAASIAAGIEPPYYFDTDARFGIVARMGAAELDDGAKAGGGGAEKEALSALLSKAKNLPEATSAVLSALVLRVSKMLGVPPEELDTGRFLHSYGVDSLAAIELVNWALRECQSRIAVFDVMAGVPMAVFSERVAVKSKLLAKGVVEAS
ncbi:Type I Iterative PKS [Exserohilum turcicum]